MTEKQLTIYEKLTNAQAELKAPKNRFNDYGKYSYRSAEDILEAVKPINKKHKLNLVLKDDITFIGDRFYVKAVAVLKDLETGEQIQVEAFAREEQNRKGMDAGQLTGATSSYARKYALNGLYLIDDTKDMDTNEYEKEDQAREQQVIEPIDNYLDFNQRVKELKQEIISIQPSTNEKKINEYLLNHLGITNINEINNHPSDTMRYLKGLLYKAKQKNRENQNNKPQIDWRN